MTKPLASEKIFSIEGMSCAACSAAVERVTRKIPGVVLSEVNLAAKTMRIVYDTGTVPDELIISKVQKAGFAAKPKDPTANFHFIKKTANAAAQKQKTSLKSQKQRLIVTWFFGFLLMYAAMGQMLSLPMPSVFSPHRHPLNFALFQLLCALPILYFGRQFFIHGYRALFYRNPNMDSLIALGSSAAFIYSLILTLMIPQNYNLIHQLYYEASALVLVFVMSGKYLESRGTEKAQEAIAKLAALMPDTVFFVDDFDSPNKKIIERPLCEIQTGNIVLVKPGTHIPLDGRVVHGYSSIDESMLTGESIPAEKEEGSLVTGGSLNLTGMLYIEITRTGSNTTLSKIISFIEEAQGKKAPISKIADKVSGIFVPIVILSAIIAGIFWALQGSELSFVLKIVTSILVIACPCALGLATPAAIMTGTGLGAANGILIRSGEALETAKYVDTLVLDKTGTITEGKPLIQGVFLRQDIPITKANLLSLAAAVETASSHPLAQAFNEVSSKIKLQNNLCLEHLSNISGKGVEAGVRGFSIPNKTDLSQTINVILGSLALMEERGIDCSFLSKIGQEEAKTGAALIYIAAGNQLLGLVSVGDKIKPSSAKAVKMLKDQGIRVILLSGDSMTAAQFAGAQIQADEVFAEVLPQDKAAFIAKLQDRGQKVMMVGDGINDAPALSQADVGAAIGQGSDIAINSGDIVLVKSDLMDLPKLIRLSRLTIRNIKQNLFWAFCYNIISLPLAAGMLYPWTGLLLNPMIGSLAMSLSSVFVISNALRLRRANLN